MADGTCSPTPEDSSTSSTATEQQQEGIAEPVAPAVASEPVPEPVAESPSQSTPAEPESQPAEEPQEQDEQPKQEEQKQEATEEEPKEEPVAEKEEVQQGSRKCYTREELQALNKDCTHKPDGLDLSDVWLRDLERTAASPDPDELAIALKPQWGRAASGLQPGRSLGLSFGRSVGSPNGPTAPIHSKLIDLGPGPEHADPLARQSLDGPGPRPRIDRFGERDLSSRGTWRQATDAARELDDRGKPVEVQRSPFAAASTRPDPPAVGRDTKGRWERGAELKDRERADSWRAAGPAPPQPRTRWDDAMHARRRHEGMEGGPTPGGADPWAEEGTPSKSLSMGSMRRTMTTQEMEREHQEFRERARAEAAKRRGAPPMGDPALIEMDMDELMDDEQRAQKYGSAAGNGKSAEPAGDQQHASSGPPQGIKISFQELAAKAGKAASTASNEQPAQAPSGAPAAASLPIRVEELEARLGATSISSQPPPAGTAAARGPPPGMGPLAGLFNQQQQQQPAAAPAAAPGAFQGNAQASQALLGLLKKSSGGPPGLGTGAGSGSVVPASMAMPAMADTSAPPGFGGPAAAAPAAPVAIAASTLDTALNPAAAAAAAAGNGLLPPVQAMPEAAAKAKPAPVGGLFNATGTASIFGGSSSFGSMAGAGAQGIETLQKLKALWGEAPQAEPPKQETKLPTVSGFALPTATALPEGTAVPGSVLAGGLSGAAASQQQAAAGAAQPTNVQQMFAKLQQQQQQPQQQAPGAGQAGAPLQALLRQLGQQQQQQQWQQQPGPGQQPPSDMGLQAWAQQAPQQSHVNAVDAAAAAAAQRNAAARLAAAGGAPNAGGANAQEFFQQFLAGARNPAAAQHQQQQHQQQQQQQQRLMQAGQQPGSAQGQQGQQAQQQGGGAGMQQPPDLAHFQQWMQQASGPGRPAAQVGVSAPAPATPGAQPRYSYGQPGYGAPGLGGAGPQQPQQPQQQPPAGVQPSSDMQALMQRLNKQPVVGPPGMPGAGVRPTATAATGINPMTGLPYGADQSGLVAQALDQARNQALMQNLLAQMRQQQPQAQPAAMQAAGLYPSAQHAHLAAAAGVPKLPGQVLPGGVGMGQQQHLMAAMAQQPNSDMQRLLASLSGGMMPQQQPQQHAQAAGLHGLSAGMPVSDLERYLMAQAQR